MYISRSHILLSVSIFIFLLAALPVKAQLGYSLEIKKPEPYENRQLRAEKSENKKFTKYRRFFQNTYTHYNYFFNANNKLNEVIAQAKEVHKDDFASLLSFYNYSLENTAQSSSLLDSVIYKAKTGIVMHDLRNDWIDDLYLLWGAAYHLQQKFDSAHQMFQFINYAFADKEKDGYYRYIGSRMDGNNALSIATKEDDKLLKRMVSDPPSRNTAFIWQIRTLIEADAMTEAGTLITTLKKDANFPERLQTSLQEVHAYWFYKQEMWDSAANHLTLALDNASNKQERARWEYLIGQLYVKANKPQHAAEYFTKSIDHTIDPVMEVYARLNLIRNNKEGGDNYIDQNIAELLKMAKREKYIDYRDIIYFMAGQMELERKNDSVAKEHLLKAAKYAINNPATKNQAFSQLADLSYANRDYLNAASYYDSVQIAELPEADANRINERKEALTKVVMHINRINRQDSLQKIAAMPEEERADYIKKLVRQLRRKQGLKEEETVTTGARFANNSSTDIFNTPSKGEWYFYNETLKKQGITTFKQQWGNRPNADNWRRASNLAMQARNNTEADANNNAVPANAATNAISFDGLLANVPLSADQMKVSNEVIRTSLLALGNSYLNELEDYPSAIETYEELRRRFPDYTGMNEVLFHLYYAYEKCGDTAKAAEIKALLQKNHAGSRETTIVTTGKDPQTSKPSTEVTKAYEAVYDQFVEGRFEEALASKRYADSVYQTNYWSPQLLYIEAVYYIKQREDSIAKNTLNLIMQQHAGTPLANKAENLLQVLNRRKEIEEELRNLNIERPQEDTVTAVVVTNTTAPQQQPETKQPEMGQPEPTKPDEPEEPKTVAIRRDTTAVQNNTAVAKQTAPTLRTDSVSAKKPEIPKPVSLSYVYDAQVPQYVMIVLNKVDNVFGNEARNAFNRYNKERYYNLPLNNELLPLDAENKLLLVGQFNDVLQATEYVQKASDLAPKEIVPWLKAEKYSFSIISKHNLEVLKANPDVAAYKKFIEQQTGIKF